MTDEVAGDDTGIALKARLRQIAALYDACHTDDDRRRTCHLALVEIALAFHHTGFSSEELRPVTAVISGLENLGKGITPPIFTLSQKKGGRPIPYEDLCQRGLAAAAVTLFMQDGTSEQVALQKVVSRIGKWRAAQNRRARRNNPGLLLEAVRDWRNNAMAGNPKQDWDARIYAKVLEDAVRSECSPSEKAEWLLTEPHKLYP